MDVLSDAITAMRAGRPHAARNRRHGAWGLRFPASDGAGFHVLLQGTAWLLPQHGAPIALSPGDVVFLARGGGYGIAHHPDAELTEFRPDPDRRGPAPDPVEDAGPSALLLCGAYLVDRARTHPLFDELPEVVHLRAEVGAHPNLRAGVDLLAKELAAPQPGSDALLPALLDTLLLYILRTWWLDQRPPRQADGGWAAALRDPGVAAALHAMHDAPARAWTVAELAAVAGLSRAAFARRFGALVGRPPLGYLTWWRMTTAGRLLRTGDTPLRTVAERAGYTSEFAFAKAFKREFGVAPGHYRRTGNPAATA